MLVHFIDTTFLLSELPEKVGIAVSGGGDSMALLHVAKRWSDLSGVSIEAVTVNHGLRAEAEDEAELVAGFCTQIDVAHTVLQWDGAQARGNIAAAGRDARYQLIADWAKARKIDGILLGHTADDIAETFLMRLARKSGVDGLSMMDIRFERNGVEWARPFWQQERAELRDYLRRHDVQWVEDPTNDDDAYQRPKARKAMVALEPLGITTEVLKSVAMTMQFARSTLEHYTTEEARRVAKCVAGDVLIAQRARPPVPPEIERRMVIASLQFVGGGQYAPRADALIEMDAGLSLSGKHTLAGCVVTADKYTLRVAREFNAVKETVVGLGHIWDNRWQVLGPAKSHFTIRALGDHIKDVPDWRETGLPRASLMATPAVFDGDTLIAAPVAGYKNGFDARIVADFESFLVSR